MAVNHDNTRPERNSSWYQAELTEVNEAFRKLLEEYSKVPKEEVVSHVNKIRSIGFSKNPYVCIGQYRFTNLTLATHPLYTEILSRLSQDGGSYLDIGCCFAQDLRKLVHGCIPSSRLMGLDIERPLMDLGYELFRDRETLQSRFVVADVFKGPTQGKAWTELVDSGFDVVHCSAFFHLFSLQEQTDAARNIAGLVRKDGVVVGRQLGSLKPGNVSVITEGMFSYRHDVQTFGKMWDEVGEKTGTRWKVEGIMDRVGTNPNLVVEDEHSRRFLSTVTRIE